MTPRKPATARVKVHIAVFRYAKYRANIENTAMAIVDHPKDGLTCIELSTVCGDRVHQVVYPDSVDVNPS